MPILNDMNFGDYFVRAFVDSDIELQQHVIKHMRTLANWWGKIEWSKSWKELKQSDPEKADSIRKQFTPNYLNDPELFVKYIRQQLQMGYDRNQIFYQIYLVFYHKDNKIASEDCLAYCFENSSENVSNEDALSEFMIEMFDCVDMECQKAKRSLTSSKCLSESREQCKILPITDRYAIDIGYNEETQLTCFILFDTFWKQKRLIEFSDDFSFKLNSKLFSVGGGQILCIEPPVQQQNGHSVVDIYLLGIDVVDFKCSITDKIPIKADKFECFQDYVNNLKFVVVSEVDNISFFYNGHIIDQTIYLESTKNDGTLYRFEYGRYTFDFNRITFEANQIKRETLHQIERKPHVLISMDTPSGWHNNAFYFFQELSGKLSLSNYDLNTQTENRIELPNLHIYEIKSMQIIDGVALISTTKYKTLRHVFYRIPLSQPDKLSNITANFLYKQTMFTDNEEFKLFIEQCVPPRFRPFAQ